MNNKNAERLREIAASIDELDVGIGNDLRRIADEMEKLLKAFDECEDLRAIANNLLGTTHEKYAYQSDDLRTLHEAFRKFKGETK